jgi:hypothetical protein
MPNGPTGSQHQRNTGAIPEQCRVLTRPPGHFPRSSAGGSLSQSRLHGLPVQDLDRSGFGINEPGFPHAVLFVKLALVNW